MKKITIYTDGASRNNPGVSASGYIIYDHEGTLISKNSVYNGIMSNNMAEYTAIVMALQWCTKNLESIEQIEIELFSDSELVVKQINRIYKSKSVQLKNMRLKVNALANHFKMVKFINVPRENKHIVIVDKQLNNLLDDLQSA